MAVLVHVGEMDVAVGVADPDVVLPVHLIQNLAIVCRKDQCRVVAVDALVLVEADHVLHQCLVEVVLRIIDQQIKPLFQGSRHQCVQKDAFGCAAGKEMDQLCIRHDPLPVFDDHTVVVVIDPGQFFDCLVKNADDLCQHIHANTITLQGSKQHLIGICSAAAAIEEYSQAFFFFKIKNTLDVSSGRSPRSLSSSYPSSSKISLALVHFESWIDCPLCIPRKAQSHIDTGTRHGRT